MSGRVAFFDIAGTLVDGNPWRGFLKSDIIGKGRIARRYLFFAAPYWAKKAGIITDTRFRQLWVRQMARLLQGLTRDDTDALFRWIAAEFMVDAYRADVVERLHAHKRNGDYVLLVSGMFTPLAHQFALHLGADAGVGTELAFDAAGVCTGQIGMEACAGTTKPECVQRHLAAQGMALDGVETFAYADSYSDVPLLAFADHAIATYPDAELAAVVAERGWERIG
jgi:HAD superfamily hydrolase (TIGR01490 family)